MPRVQGKTIENMAPVQFRIIQMRSFVVTANVAALHINWFNAAPCQEWRVKPLKIWHHLVNYENISSRTGYTCNWNIFTTQDLCLNQVQNWKAIIWSLCWTCQSIQVNTNVFKLRYLTLRNHCSDRAIRVSLFSLSPSSVPWGILHYPLIKYFISHLFSHSYSGFLL